MRVSPLLVVLGVLGVANALTACHRDGDEHQAPPPAHLDVARAPWSARAEPAGDASPYESLAIRPTLLTAHTGQRVWAAAEDKHGLWTLNLYTAVATTGLVWTVMGQQEQHAPQGLIAAIPDDVLAAGTPVMIATDRPTFGIMEEARGDQALVRYMFFGGGIRDALVDAERVRVVDPGREAFGSPVAIDVGGQWHGGVVVGRADGGWEVIRGSAKNSTVERVDAARVLFVDPTARYSKGAAVLFGPDASSSDPVWLEGTVLGPAGEGLGYLVRGPEDRIVPVSWSAIVGRPRGSPPTTP